MKISLILIAAFCSFHLAAQVPFPAMDSIDINNINAVALVHGDMWWKPGATSIANRYGCFYPNGTRKPLSFAAAMWLSGYDDGGNLHVSAQTYRQDGNDYWPGPLDGSGNLSYTTSSEWARIWKVTRADVEAYKAYAFHTVTNTPASILAWPGKGNSHAKGRDNMPLVVDKEMAPFIDRNGDGIYQPLKGDYPDFKGDQALWWVVSDNGPSHNQTNGQPLKAEVKVMANAYKRNTLIDNVVYYDYAITNRSATNYRNVRWALWHDVDFGYYSGEYAHFDSARRLGIIFHEYRPGISGEPANVIIDTSSRGVTLIHQPGDEGSSYEPAGSFIYYNNDPSIIGNPASPGDYSGYMRATLRNGVHFNAGGVDVNYLFTEDPSLPGSAGCAGSVTRGRRFVLSTADFSLSAGHTEHVLIALVADSTTGGCPRLNFAGIKATADTAWAVYHNPPPEVGVRDEAVANAHLSVFPNPAQDHVTVLLPGAEDGTLDVFDVVGVRVASTLIHNGAAGLDVAMLPPGLYVVRVNGSVGTASAYFVKQ